MHGCVNYVLGGGGSGDFHYTFVWAGGYGDGGWQDEMKGVCTIIRYHLEATTRSGTKTHCFRLVMCYCENPSENAMIHWQARHSPILCLVATKDLGEVLQCQSQ